MASSVIVTRGKYFTVADALKQRRWFEDPRVHEVLLGLAGIGIFLSLWAGVVYLGVVDQRFLAAPHAVAQTFVQLTLDGSLVGQAGTTLWRVLVGFALGTGSGLIVGFGMALSRHIRAAIYPLFAATFPLPKIALLPLSMVYLGIGDAPIVAVVAVSAFYLVPVNVMAAVESIDKIYDDVAQDLEVSRRLYRRTIAIPYALPMILASLRSAWAISLIVVVASEMLIGDAGIGFLIWQSGQFLRVELMFSAFVVIGLLGYGSHLVFDWLTGVVTPWQVGR